jgi:hypothetical protein
MGWGIQFGLRQIQDKNVQSSFAAPEQIGTPKTNERELSPFFIPLPEGSGKCVIKIVLKATWDRSASILFRKREPEIRDHLYMHFCGLALKGEDQGKRTLSLEAEVGDILKKFLGDADLEIRIIEIKYI